MPGRVEGKVALITGAASGIGLGCAQRLAEDGAKIVLTDVQDDKGRRSAEAIAAKGANAWYMH